MGYDRHHAIVVTGFDVEDTEKARKKAQDLCPGQVSELLISPVNRWATFLIGPDGSKEGWEDSTEGDAARASMLAWLDAQRYEDGSSPFDWVEVQYGDDDEQTIIIRHSDEPTP